MFILYLFHIQPFSKGHCQVKLYKTAEICCSKFTQKTSMCELCPSPLPYIRNINRNRDGTETQSNSGDDLLLFFFQNSK